MDDLLEDSNHLQAAICKEAVKTYASWVSERQASLNFALPICMEVLIDLLPVLPSACLPSAQPLKEHISEKDCSCIKAISQRAKGHQSLWKASENTLDIGTSNPC